MMESVDNSAMAAEATPGPVVFDARRGPLMRLLVKNLVLGFLTVGIYRFWAKTNVRRFFWRHVSIAGEPLEYTGRGTELLIGLLVAVAVLGAVVAVIQVLDAMSAGSVVAVRAGLQLAYYATLLWLIQVAVFRMRRYRLTRTLWRGIRFGLDGSSLRYGLVSLGYGMLTVITFGVTYPVRRVALTHYVITRARYGTQPFAFGAEAKPLMQSWLFVFFTALGAWVVFFWLNSSFFQALDKDPAADGGVVATVSDHLVPLLLSLAGLVIPLYFYAQYRVYEFEYFVRSSTVGDTSFETDLAPRTVYKLTLIYMLLMIVGVGALFGLSFVIGELIEAASRPATFDAPHPQYLLLGVLALILVLLGVLSIVKTGWLQFDLVRFIFRSLRITNLAAVDAVVQSSRDIPSRGEGLADALDVGDF